MVSRRPLYPATIDMYFDNLTVGVTFHLCELPSFEKMTGCTGDSVLFHTRVTSYDP
jgi:hypothetical protein